MSQSQSAYGTSYDGSAPARLLKLCPSFDSLQADELIETCDMCGRYYTVCCQHRSWETAGVCHHHAVVFVDGACSRNGLADAQAGIGCAIGDGAGHCLSLPVTEDMDPGHRRTSQRAELLAALHGVDFLVKAKRSNPNVSAKGVVYVVAADSEYVVKGMTEWVPRWKANGWKKSDGRFPANLDLFRRLDEKVSQYEARGLDVRFFHVPRAVNAVADGLAKDGAARATVVYVL
ncbi:Ribonuclease H-like protein [Mycena chlorophos]|uniref:ribonuclease H n=1 Tax=Mycena chlorophos TaxID=658473 RepID=A0A8H6SHV4_MYCCL|nr:Ribonuclease H-like protein [Mycena chlorophos]